MDFGLVIPVYNEAKRLGSVLSQCMTLLPPNRIYVVNDGSTDNTVEIALEHGVVLLQHRENLGKGEALKTGFRKAVMDGCEAVITLDGDGQHDPDDIQLLIDVYRKEPCDLVLGNRQFKTRDMPFIRLVSNRISSALVSLWSGLHIPDSQCGYRLIRVAVLQAVDIETGSFVAESELLIKAVRHGFSVAFCPVKLKYEGGGNRMNPVEIIRFAGMLLKLIRRR